MTCISILLRKARRDSRIPAVIRGSSPRLKLTYPLNDWAVGDVTFDWPVPVGRNVINTQLNAEQREFIGEQYAVHGVQEIVHQRILHGSAMMRQLHLLQFAESSRNSIPFSPTASDWDRVQPYRVIESYWVGHG
jgi:hypothetical protein